MLFIQNKQVVGNRMDILWRARMAKLSSTHITDIDIITETLEYFFKHCDPGKSPQSLWMDANKNSYQSLLLDKDDTTDDTFQSVMEHLAALCLGLVPSDNIDSLEVAYPESWTVSYIEM